MGFLDALTADAYPRDTQGRRVFTPYGARGRAYILPTDRAERLARQQRRLFQFYGVALLVAGVAFGPWAVLAVGVLGLAAFFAILASVARGLEETAERPTLSREERVNRGIRAMGRPTMLVVCLVGAASAVAGGSLLLRGQDNVAVWFITLYGAVVAVLYARQLSRSGHERRQPNER